MDSDRANRAANRGAHGADCGNGLLDPVYFVTAEVVEDYDVSGPQCGAQELFDPGQQQLAVHGPSTTTAAVN